MSNIAPLQHWIDSGNTSHCIIYVRWNFIRLSNILNWTLYYVHYYTPNICSVTAEVSDEAPTHLRELTQLIMLVHTPTWKASLGRHAAYCLRLCCQALCDSRRLVNTHRTHTDALAHKLADGLSECRSCWNPRIALREWKTRQKEGEKQTEGEKRAEGRGQGGEGTRREV